MRVYLVTVLSVLAATTVSAFPAPPLPGAAVLQNAAVDSAEGLTRRMPQLGLDTLVSSFGKPPTNTNNMANNAAAMRKYTDDQASAMQVAQHSSNGKTRRAQDSGTAGGNAYTGTTDSVSGGSVVNVAPDDATITNNGGNMAGSAGATESGIATGGNGDGLGPGGNAYSGSSGNARGGIVLNHAGVVDNDSTTMTNTAGNGGTSFTGDAFGGNSGSGFDDDDNDDSDDFLDRIGDDRDLVED